MAVYRIKFIWGSGDVIKARWWFGLLGFYVHRPGFPGSGLAVSLRGLLRWLAALAVVGYFAGAVAMTQWLRRNPYNKIGFADVLTWPVRRAHVAELRGRGWIAQGTAAFGAGNWGEGGFLLQHGLELCPDDFAARMTLAQFFVLSGRRPRAMTTLAEGPRHGLPPRAWIQQAIVFGQDSEDWNFIVAICDQCLPRLTGTAQWPEQQWVLSQKLAALLALGRTGEVLALAEAEGDAASAAVKTQRALALQALGRNDAALEFVGHWRATADRAAFPSAIRAQAQALREAGHLDEMDRTLDELCASMPGSPDPAAFAVVERVRAHRGADALEEYFRRFASTPANLMLVAAPLGAIPDVALTRRVAAVASEHGFVLRPFQVQLAQALLRAGEWDELARLTGELAPRFEQAEGEPKLWFAWIQVVSDAVSLPDAAAQDRLQAFVGDRPLSLQACRETITALRRSGHVETAARVLPGMLQHFPESAWFGAQQTEVDHDLKAAAILAAARAPAKPPAPAGPANWPELAAAVDAAIAASHWTEAQKIVESARAVRPAPAWLLAHDADVLRRELRIDQRLGEIPALRLTASLFLSGDPMRTKELLALAREVDSAGARTDAVMLVKAVLEKFPDDADAAELFARLQPRPKADPR